MSFLALAIHGSIVVAGAYDNNDHGGDSGSAYVFERDAGGAGNWGEVKKLTASDADRDFRFGYAVAMTDDTLVISAPGGISPNLQAGKVYVFEKPGASWTQAVEVAQLTASVPDPQGFFGRSLAIHGDTVVVGARGRWPSSCHVDRDIYCWGVLDA